jgi:trimethylamine:corrinoid methyltransferase-like protein
LGKDGQKDIEQRAIEKSKEILASHHPARLSLDIEAEIDRIARDP